MTLAKLRAFSVHIFTATGTALAFLALIDALNAEWPSMFVWLGISLLVDAIDGPLARRLNIVETLPNWSGATLDLVVDFLTYVFVPAFAIAASGVLPNVAAIPAGMLIVVTGALYFADQRMKTEDNYFRGFPALWNLVAFYLLLLTPPPAIAAGIVAALLVLTFVPFPFIHPVRVARFRTLNLALMGVWAMLAAAALWYDLAPGPWITGGLCAIGVYVLAAGILRRAA
jgi:phosphatidylcholine synthase